MSYDEPLVGTVAIVVGVIASAIAVGPWNEPYRLRTMARVSDRFGKPWARGLWAVIAAAMLIAGLAIFQGVRPSYAAPPPGVAGER